MLDLLAHATPITYRFPLPIWVYVLAAGAVVLLSAPAAALGSREAAPARTWRSRSLYPALRPLRLGAVGLALASVLFLVALVGGLGGTAPIAFLFLPGMRDTERDGSVTSRLSAAAKEAAPVA